MKKDERLSRCWILEGKVRRENPDNHRGKIEKKGKK